ncbi:hypothetical protein A2U01_0062245 [Trifolium medium]|uniref:Uncharacterized protein n=1 Tax=Trifolium medium TaxID=97028 RepID=A0A392RXY9_9FABA|nr:hypothetical protein [Trifolium medium]
MVTTPPSSWYFILRCTVEGTAPSVAKVGCPRMQLYGDSHGTVDPLNPQGRIVDPLNPCKSVPS